MPRKIHMALNETLFKENAMPMSIEEMMKIVQSLYEKQGDRLIKSDMTFENFMNLPAEEAVTFEIDCYENLIAGMYNPKHVAA